MSKLVCKNLSGGYNQNEVIKNISFEVSKGEVLVIVGENGSGKSTLVKLLTGILKKNQGEVIYPRNSKIGYVSQSVAIQEGFPVTVFEVVYSGATQIFFNKRKQVQKETNRALNCLERVNMTSFKNTSFHQLSGGQKQKVLLARAMMISNEILILDEPLKGLDVESKKQLMIFIESMKNEGMILIIVSHDALFKEQKGYKYLDLSKEVEKMPTIQSCSLEVN